MYGFNNLYPVVWPLLPYIFRKGGKTIKQGEQITWTRDRRGKIVSVVVRKVDSTYRHPTRKEKKQFFLDKGVSGV